MPGVIEEALNTLNERHLLIALRGFGGAARDASIALGLLAPDLRIAHAQTGTGYEDSLAAMTRYADAYQGWARESGIWNDLAAAARAEDPEQVSRHVARVWVPLEQTLEREGPEASEPV
jgi:hypothetical protein